MKNFFSFLLSAISCVLTILLSVLFPLILVVLGIWLVYAIGESDLPFWVKLWLLSK